MSKASEREPYPFEDWDARDINYVLDSINKNIPAEECSMRLNDAQKKRYEEMRARLAIENKGYDRWIIGYDMMELE